VATAAGGRPTVQGVTCRTGCLGPARATPGSVLRGTGDDAGGAASIVPPAPWEPEPGRARDSRP
jgi:hypothetical protein